MGFDKGTSLLHLGMLVHLLSMMSTNKKQILELFGYVSGNRE